MLKFYSEGKLCIKLFSWEILRPVKAVWQDCQDSITCQLRVWWSWGYSIAEEMLRLLIRLG